MFVMTTTIDQLLNEDVDNLNTNIFFGLQFIVAHTKLYVIRGRLRKVFAELWR